MPGYEVDVSLKIGRYFFAALQRKRDFDWNMIFISANIDIRGSPSASFTERDVPALRHSRNSIARSEPAIMVPVRGPYSNGLLNSYFWLAFAPTETDILNSYEF